MWLRHKNETGGGSRPLGTDSAEVTQSLGRIRNGSRVHIIYSQSQAIIEALEGIIYSRRAEYQTMNIETSAGFFLVTGAAEPSDFLSVISTESRGTSS